MAASAGAGSPGAPAASGASAAAARRGTGAARRSGIGLIGTGGHREHSGGEAEKGEARVAQEPAAPEPDLRELFVVDLCLELLNLGSG